MRLAQLARKISVKSVEIKEFLEIHNIQIDNSSNAKVNDEHVEMVLKHFAPEMVTKVEPDPDLVKTIEKVESVAGEEIPDEEEVKAQNDIESPDEIVEASEVIKPIKVELPGLRVVGKIDLPEPKKKEEKPIDDNEVSGEDQPKTSGNEVARNPRSERRKPNRPNRDNDRRPRKNPIALQREREEREALRRKLEDKEKEKELRTQRYLKKVSSKVTAPKPLRKKRAEEEYEVYSEENSKPKTVIGKILNWFVSK